MRWLVSAVSVLVLSLIAMVTVLDEVPSASPDGPPIPRTGDGLRPGSVPRQYARLVLQAGSLCPAAPSAVIAAQVRQESNWDPHAVSPAGAEGISQFLPTTWPQWSTPGESPFDPSAAILAQGRYDCAIAATIAAAQQRGQLPRSVDLTSLMLAGYNAGPAAVLTARGVPPIAETRNYVQAILASAPDFAGATVSSGHVEAGSFAAREIAAAKRYLGYPYAWAGGDYFGPTRGQCVAGPAARDCEKVGFDCSGLVLYAVYVASRGEIHLGHSADQQTRHGAPVPISQLRPGDLISFTDPGSTIAHHVGIYLGDDRLLNAPESNADVRVDSLATPYYHGQTWRAVRYG